MYQIYPSLFSNSIIPKQNRSHCSNVVCDGAALLAECKWTNEKVDLSVLETPVECSKLFSCKKKYFYLFAKSGFAKGCMDKAAEMGNVTLVAYHEMLEHQRK